MLFEDMQWADASLLDFIEYLLEWAPQLADPRRHPGSPRAARAAADLGRRSPQLQLALPRAALRRGDGGAARRSRSWPARRSCGRRSSPGRRGSRSTRSRPCACCSTGARSSRRGRSTGRPGTIESLEVPETLHALIAARLDGLPAEERRVVQDAAVLGKTFTKQALAALTGLPDGELEPLLSSLVAQGGLRRPGRPALARARPVRLPPGPAAQGRLRDAGRRRDRKVRHLAAAAFLERRSPSRRSSRSSPRTTLPPMRRRPTRPTLPRSGRRPASSSPAPASAPRRSARTRRPSATSPRRRSSTDDPAGEGGAARARRSHGLARGKGESRRERSSSRRSRSSRPRGSHRQAARVSAHLAEIDFRDGHPPEAVARLEAALETLAGEEPDEDVAFAAAQLGRFLVAQPAARPGGSRGSRSRSSSPRRCASRRSSPRH